MTPAEIGFFLSGFLVGLGLAFLLVAAFARPRVVVDIDPTTVN